MYTFTSTDVYAIHTHTHSCIFIYVNVLMLRGLPSLLTYIYVYSAIKKIINSIKKMQKIMETFQISNLLSYLHVESK